MQTNPNIYDVQYTRCNSNSQSAARIVRYLRRRPLDKEHPGRESEWRELGEDQQFGDAESFKREAQRRKNERLRSAERRGKDISQDHSPGNVSYMHIVISPSSREDFGNEDFGALLDPWIRDEHGRMYEHYGAIHRDDPEGPKIHLVVARDRIHKNRELPAMKEHTAEIIREREALLERSRDPERTPETERQYDHEPHREAHMEHDGYSDEERQRGAEREAERDFYEKVDDYLEQNPEADPEAAARHVNETGTSEKEQTATHDQHREANETSKEDEPQREGENNNPFRQGGRDPFRENDTDRDRDTDRER